MPNIIDTPRLPVLFAYLANSVSGITGNGTAYTVVFDTVVFGSGYNTSTGIYTAPYSGNYLITFNLFFNNIINGANNNISSITIAGTSTRVSENSNLTTRDPSSNYILNTGFITNISATQTINVVAQINNGSAASVGLSAGNSPYLTWLFIKYLP